MYPSWSPTLNLCVIEARSSCSLWRTARGGAFRSSSSTSTACGGARRASSLVEFAVLVPAADKRLRLLASVAIDGDCLQAELPGLEVGFRDVFDAWRSRED